MKRIPIIVAMAGIAAALSLPAAAQNRDHPLQGQYSLEHMKATSKPSGRYGSPAGSLAYDREITLDSTTRSVSVLHGETVKFVLPGTGREFRWRFDTLKRNDAFALANIVPTDVRAHPAVTVYVKGDKAPS